MEIERTLMDSTFLFGLGRRGPRGGGVYGRSSFSVFFSPSMKKFAEEEKKKDFQRFGSIRFQFFNIFLVEIVFGGVE